MLRPPTPKSPAWEGPPKHSVTRVPFVYGGHYYVATADLLNTAKTLLPLYTRHGFKWEDTLGGQRAVRRNEATSLHRENIGFEIKE